MPAAGASDIFQSLNNAQRRAVSSNASTVAILAGPGSGKTHTLTSRVVWLINNVGVKPSDIIVATFTVKAAKEMKTRIGNALGGDQEKRIILGTFHSIARRYLAAYGELIGLNKKFAIADDSDSRGIIQRICKRLDAPVEPAMARGWISKRKARGTSDERTVKAKNGKDVESRALEQCFEEYQAQLERSNLLDYDDLLVRCVELLRKFPSCVANIQVVLIDEYQDTNGVQYDLMKLLAQRQRRITVVGDPDQSIYGWRSAEIRNLHRLLREFPGTDEVALEENYRSSSSILDVSLKVIQQDEERYKKVLLPVRNRGTKPVLRHLTTLQTEAEWIVSEIKRVQLMSGNMINLNDISILLRSASLSRHIESSLGREGIAYRMVGGFKFYERTEIKTILDYLRIIYQPDNNDALARIMNVPKRGIGDATIKSLLEEAERSAMSLWKLLVKHCRGERAAKTTIRKQTEQRISGELIRLIEGLRARSQRSHESPLNLVEVIEKLLRDLRFQDYLESAYAESESRWANVQEFLTLAGEFMKSQADENDESLPAISGLDQNLDSDVMARFLANVSLASDKQTNQPDQEQKPMITVSTIHAAKGLEWPVVFIPAVYKGSIPHMRSDDDAEERRLLYVAMTRAQTLLYLSHPLSTSYGGGDGGALLSPFIADISSVNFLKKGPSLDRRVMAEIAQILGRTLPSEEAIYKAMPPMQAMEDDRFPVDPRPEASGGGVSSGERQNSAAHYKRRKISHPLKSTPVAPESVDGWITPSTTTMDKSGSFTIPQNQHPGFTTAGSHYAAVAAATERAGVKQPPQSIAKKQTGSRAPAQRSLLGYMGIVENHDKSQSEPTRPISQQASAQVTAMSVRQPARPHSGSKGYQNETVRLPPAWQPASESGIDPGLAKHKLGSGNPATKPPLRRDKADEKIHISNKQYTCFSSSPTKGSPEKKHQNAEDSTAKENIVPPEEQVRPAASFHSTTVSRPLGLGGMGPGIKRPAPLGRSGIAPVDRLKKPFKLTVKRP